MCIFLNNQSSQSFGKYSLKHIFKTYIFDQEQLIFSYKTLNKRLDMQQFLPTHALIHPQNPHQPPQLLTCSQDNFPSQFDTCPSLRFPGPSSLWRNYVFIRESRALTGTINYFSPWGSTDTKTDHQGVPTWLFQDHYSLKTLPFGRQEIYIKVASYIDQYMTNLFRPNLIKALH